MNEPLLATEVLGTVPIERLQIPSITFLEAEILTPISGEWSPRETSQKQVWNDLSDLYNLSNTLKGDVAVLDGSSGKRKNEKGTTTAEKLDDLLDTFINGANGVLEELSILGNVHPIIAGELPLLPMMT